MAAASYTTVSISWRADKVDARVTFTPHGDFAKRQVVVQLDLSWAELSRDQREATVQALLACAEALGDY